MTRDKIIADLFTGKNFTDCIAKMEPEQLRDDLKQEVILIICELDEGKLIGLWQRKELEFFTVRVILNQIKSNSSPFARKFRNNLLMFMDEVNDDMQGLNVSPNWVHSDISPDEFEERLVHEEVQALAIEEINKLHWYHRGLIELYSKHGNYRAIEKETGIPFGSCYKSIRKALDGIKNRVTGTAKPVFTRQELHFIQNNNSLCNTTKL